MSVLSCNVIGSWLHALAVVDGGLDHSQVITHWVMLNIRPCLQYNTIYDRQIGVDSRELRVPLRKTFIHDHVYRCKFCSVVHCHCDGLQVCRHRSCNTWIPLNLSV